MVLLQSAESRVPTRCAPEDLKQSVIPKRGVGEIRCDILFALEQSMRGKASLIRQWVRSQMMVESLTQRQTTIILQSGQAESYSIAVIQGRHLK